MMEHLWMLPLVSSNYDIHEARRRGRYCHWCKMQEIDEAGNVRSRQGCKGQS